MLLIDDRTVSMGGCLAGTNEEFLLGYHGVLVGFHSDVPGQYKCNCMAYIRIHLDDATEKLVRRHTKASGKSVSQWVADAVRRRARREWRPDVLAHWLTDLP